MIIKRLLLSGYSKNHASLLLKISCSNLCSICPI